MLRVTGPEHRKRGLEKVGDRGSFAKEFGIKADAKSVSGRLAACCLQDRDYDIIGSAGQYCAAQHNPVKSLLLAQGRSDFATDLLDMREVELAIALARSPHADK